MRYNRFVTSATASPPLNAFSVDVEEYFQVSVFDGRLPSVQREALPSRVEDSVRKIADLLESAGARATWFCLGDVAAKHPTLIREIAARGHEIASHGMSHGKLDRLGEAKARRELVDSRLLLEDVSGTSVRGFRAPSFSITRRNLWALDAVLDAGYAYDSSIFPIGRPDYGISGFPLAPHRMTAPSGRSLIEFPMTVATCFGARMPVSGGGYFRLLPYAVTRWGFSRVNAAGRSGMFYMHPWEIDAEQPDLRREAGAVGAFRHYTGLAATEGRLRRLVGDFAFARVDAVLAAAGLL